MSIIVILPFVASDSSSPLWSIIYPAMLFCEFAGKFDARLTFGLIASAALLVALACLASRARTRGGGLGIFIGGWALLALLALISQGYRFDLGNRHPAASDTDGSPIIR
jgi:hypothetical protein